MTPPFRQFEPRPIRFAMCRGGGITAAPGLTVTIWLSKDGAAFSQARGRVEDRGNGQYRFMPARGDLDTPGTLVFHAVAVVGSALTATFRVIAAARQETP